MKKDNKLKIFIILLILIIIGLLSYIAIIKKEKTSEETKTEEISQQKKEENLEEISDKLIEKIDKYYLDYYDNLNNLDFTKLKKEDLIDGAYHYSISSNQIFTKSLVDEYYQSLFNIKLNDYPDVECFAGDGLLYSYDKEKKEYKEECGINEGICHGHGAVGYHKPLIIEKQNIEKNNNQYIITTTKVFGLDERDSDGYLYSDSSYQNKIEKLNTFIDNAKNEYGAIEHNKINTEEINNYYKDNYQEFKNIKPYYKYTFEKENNDYYLTQFEIIK